MGKEFNDLTCEELCDLMCGAPEEEEEDYSEDCINRAEAQKHIYTRLYESALNNVGYECDASEVFTDIAENRLGTWISEIPSIQPKSKTGHWIKSSNGMFAECSDCGKHGEYGLLKQYKYCPDCGAKMESDSWQQA
jgi:hypothetical protein